MNTNNRDQIINYIEDVKKGLDDVLDLNLNCLDERMEILNGVYNKLDGVLWMTRSEKDIDFAKPVDNFRTLSSFARYVQSDVVYNEMNKIFALSQHNVPEYHLVDVDHRRISKCIVYLDTVIEVLKFQYN